MARSDYDHWNEEADYIWWQEEGRHGTYEEPDDDGWDWAEAEYEDWAEEDDEADTATGEPEYPYREDYGWAGMTE